MLFTFHLWKGNKNQVIQFHLMTYIQYCDILMVQDISKLYIIVALVLFLPYLIDGRVRREMETAGMP